MAEWLVIMDGDEGAYGGFQSREDAEDFAATMEDDTGRKAEKIIHYQREDW